MMFEGEEYPYEIVSRERHKIGRILVIQDMLRIEGELFPYTYTKMRDSVCVFPICPEGVVVIEQYRHSLNRWVMESPAGAIDPDETARDAAKRELKEETGYIAEELIDLGRYCVDEGVSSSRCQIFFARCTEKTGANMEKTELIRTRVLSPKEFADMVDQNGFHMLAGLVAWYRAQNMGLI